MLNKIALGTANFTLPYGILGKGAALDQKAVADICACAVAHNIKTLDTAFAYGDLFGIIGEGAYVAELQIITKFSVLDDYEQLHNHLKQILQKYGLARFYGLLVHDPQNLGKIDKDKLARFLTMLRTEGIVSKLGISVYELDDVKQFHEIFVPDLIQIPLNPLNQKFSCDEFKSYVTNHRIEVYARSLFLQGILLAEQLPESLKMLEPIWQKFNSIAYSRGSRLETLLLWAESQEWVNNWVLGVSSVEDLKAIINQGSNIKHEAFTEELFRELKNAHHPLVDPRNWGKV